MAKQKSNPAGANSGQFLAHDIADCPSLCESYGPEVVEPKGFAKGGITAIGWLAGSGNVLPQRNISVDDTATRAKERK